MAADRQLEVWEQFVREGHCEEEAIAPPVLHSWRRCAAQRVDPQGRPSHQPLPPGRDAQALQARLRAQLEDITPISEQPGFALVLTDAACMVLDVQGDATLMAQLAACGCVPGASLSESHTGTNAIDLALREALPAQTVGADHFCRIYHPFACAAAPLFDGAERIIGALAIVARAEMAHPHTLALAIAAAQALHGQLRNELLLAEANDQLAELYATLEAMSEGLIFVDPTGNVRRINNRAAQMIGTTTRSAAGQPLGRVVTPPAPVRAALEERRELNDKELIWQGRRDTLVAVCSLRPVWDRGRRYLGALITLRPAHSVQQLVHEVVGARAQFTFHDIIGQSQAMAQALHRAHQAANSTACVLLRGEPGVGKELFAQSIHNAGVQASGPYIRVNCAAVPRTLLAGELFGVEGGEDRGEQGRPGKIELAHGGTLFLEEVGVLPFDLQTSLLRTIEMHHLIRSSGMRAIPVSVRVIATGAPDLDRLVAEGRFRPDLAARLSSFSIEVPPLRERGNDLLLLTSYLLRMLAERLGKQIALAPEALQALRVYPWPGNVRELELTLERLLQTTEKTVLTLDDLPQHIAAAAAGMVVTPGSTLADSQALTECEAILRAGRQAAGHLGRTAEILGVSRATLWRKMTRYGLTRAHFWQR